MPKPPNPIVSPIAAAAAVAAEGAVDANERLDRLEERVSQLEPLLESREQEDRFDAVFTEYVKSLRDEQSFMKVARWVFGILACVVVLLLIVVISLAIFSSDSPLLKVATPTASVAIFLVGMFSALALLLSGLMKGLLRSAAERHSDGFLPPQISEALKLHDRLNGKS